MSLADAVTEIADDMEKDSAAHVANGTLGYGTIDLLGSYAKQLRRAVKAAEGMETYPSLLGAARIGPGIVDPAVAKTMNRDLIEAVKGEFRGKVQKIDAPVDPDLVKAEEGAGGGMVELAGGAHEGTLVPLPPGMPVDGYTAVLGERYQLRADGRLHHAPPKRGLQIGG